MDQNKQGVNVLIFTDLGSFGHMKTAGPYRIATELRSNGYTVQVVDHFTFFSKEQVFQIVDKFVGSSTLWVGFSTTFFNRVYDDEFAQKVRDAEKDATYSRRSFTKGIPIDYLDELVAKIRGIKPTIKLVVGGGKSIYLHDECIDAFIIGYGDSMVVHYTKHLDGKNPFFACKKTKDGRLIINYDVKGEKFDFLNSTIKWEDQDLIFYGEPLPIEISRGCIFRCKFCAYPLNGKKKLDFIKSYDVLYSEFMRNYEKFGTTEYIFSDDTYNDSTEKLEVMLKVAQKLPFKLQYATYIRHDLIWKHREMAELLVESGLRSATFGVETLNYEAGKAVGKGLHPEKTYEVLSWLRDEKWKDRVVTFSGFIAGLPHDTRETIENWAEELLDFNYPLDSFRIVPFGMSRNRALLGNQSEFELNYKDYGYEFKTADVHDFNWYNKFSNTTFREMGDLCDQIMVHALLINRLRISSFHIPMFKMLDYTDDQLMYLTGKNHNTFLQRRLEVVKQYYTKLIKHA